MPILLSIIVPVYNGAATLAACLEHLMRCRFPKDWYEVIVVDNNSTDATRQIVHKFRVRYLLETQRGQSSARNLGAQNAQGEILGFIDADCLVAPEWPQQVMRTFQKDPLAAVVGTRVPVYYDFAGRLQSLEYQRYWEASLKQAPPLNKICGSNCAIRKSVFFKLGGFDPQLLVFEDIELGYRLADNGWQIGHNPELIVKHIYRDGLSVRYQKMNQHGFSEYLAFQKHRHNPQIRAWMPAFQRLYFQSLAALHFRRPLNAAAALLNWNAKCFARLLNLARPENEKWYRIYELGLHCALFRGKLLALLAENSKSSE